MNQGGDLFKRTRECSLGISIITVSVRKGMSYKLFLFFLVCHEILLELFSASTDTFESERTQ